MSLTINIATRGRPDLLRKTVESTLPNISRADTKLMVSLDEDDTQTLRSIKMVFPRDPRLLLSIKSREDSRGEKYDRALTEAPADVYMPAVDCAPITTPGFDQIILDKAALFPDGIGVVRTPYINGLFPPALQAITAKLVEKIGYIYNHEYPFWFIDHELHDMARLIGRYLEARITVETGPMRPTKTIRMRDVAFWASYYDMMALERRAKARAIIDGADFLSPDHVKAHLKDNYHGIEHEARGINEHVRQKAAAIEAQRGDQSPPDEGYTRAKTKAEQKLAAFLDQLKAA